MHRLPVLLSSLEDEFSFICGTLIPDFLKLSCLWLVIQQHQVSCRSRCRGAVCIVCSALDSFLAYCYTSFIFIHPSFCLLMSHLAYPFSTAWYVWWNRLINRKISSICPVSASSTVRDGGSLVIGKIYSLAKSWTSSNNRQVLGHKDRFVRYYLH